MSNHGTRTTPTGCHCGGSYPLKEDEAGFYGVCNCGWEGKRRSIRTDAVLDCNAHRKRNHIVQWYIRPEIKHKRSKPLVAAG